MREGTRKPINLLRNCCMLQTIANPKSWSSSDSAKLVEKDNSSNWRWCQRCSYDKGSPYWGWIVWLRGYGVSAGKWLCSSWVPYVVETSIGAWEMELYEDCRDDPLLFLQKYALYRPTIHLRFLLRLQWADPLWRLLYFAVQSVFYVAASCD